MRGAIRSEMLRSVSGTSIPAVYLVAVLMPIFVLFSDGSRLEQVGADATADTVLLLQPLAWCAVSAAFVSAYGVTRESYYGSMDRTLAGIGFPRAFWGKLSAGAVIALALTLCTFVAWTAGASVLLAQHGLTIALTSQAWSIYAGAVAGAVIGAVSGCAIGWISRNYYVTAAIVLVIPMAVELALLRTAPDVARYSPGLVLAALGVPGYQGRLLEFGPALVVALLWAVGLTLVAWSLGRKRTG